jgi:hypothetical protein
MCAEENVRIEVEVGGQMWIEGTSIQKRITQMGHVKHTWKWITCNNFVGKRQFGISIL